MTRFFFLIEIVFISDSGSKHVRPITWLIFFMHLKKEKIFITVLQ